MLCPLWLVSNEHPRMFEGIRRVRVSVSAESKILGNRFSIVYVRVFTSRTVHIQFGVGMAKLEVDVYMKRKDSSRS